LSAVKARISQLPRSGFVQYKLPGNTLHPSRTLVGNDIDNYIEASPQNIWALVSEKFDEIEKGKELDNPNAQSNITNIYQTLLNSPHIIPAQRIKMHSIFLTIHSFLATVIGYFISQNHGFWIKWPLHDKFTFLIWPFLFVIFLSYIWFKTLEQYNTLNTIFIMVTRRLETHLPAEPISATFSVLHKIKGTYNLGSIIKYLPIGFALLYLSTFICVLIS